MTRDEPAQPPQTGLDERADGQRVDEGADPDRSTQRPTCAEHQHFDAGADGPDGRREASRGAQHHAVPRPRPDVGRHVQGAGERVETGGCQVLESASSQRVGAREPRLAAEHVDPQPEHDHVESSTDAWPLSEPRPCDDEQDEAGQLRDGAVAQAGTERDALVEHRPWRHAHACGEHGSGAETHEGEAGVEHHQPAKPRRGCAPHTSSLRQWRRRRQGRTNRPSA